MNEFRQGFLKGKREQVFRDWVRQVRARAKVKVEQAKL
jgi:hypothetical protein